MKLIHIEPYARLESYAQRGRTEKRVVQELIDNMREKGLLEGIEVDIDAGTAKVTKQTRDDDFLAQTSVGVLEKIREYSAMNKYDAIVCQGTMEPGFHGGRVVSKIPVAFAFHSSVHAASLVGDRFSVLELTDAMAQIARRHVEGYGLGRKCVSVRNLGRSSTDIGSVIHARKKEQRAGDPGVQKILVAVLEQCLAAVEKDGADTIIIGCTPLQFLEDEIRQRLDAAGYDEIQLICELTAAVEMAKVMVNLRVRQAPRAFPSDELKAKPEYR